MADAELFLRKANESLESADSDFAENMGVYVIHAGEPKVAGA